MKSYTDKSIPYLVAALIVGIAAHSPFIPWWINLWCFSLWGYLICAHRYSWSLAPKSFRIVLTIIAFTAVVTTTGRTFGNEAGIGLLCLMASLKPFEIHNHRDRMITIFLAYFMVIASLFFSTTIPMTIYMIISIVIITGFLIRINHNEVPLKTAMKLAGNITAQAIPLMLILFFLFPRIQGNFWGLQQRKTAITGFSSTLAPGMVSNLVKNNAVAFRVSFNGEEPEYTKLYWRGIIFQHFNGKEWKAEARTPDAIKVFQGSLPISYQLLMEPDHSKWIFALDLPFNNPSGTSLLADGTIVSKQARLKKISYELSSQLQYNTGNLSPWEAISLDLPEAGNIRSRALAKDLFAISDSPFEYARQVMTFFNEKEFHYTLNPAIPGKDTIDDFLFKDMKGYCEHYAAAFVFLMRAAGIPARIVGGYMGGEKNPYGDYIIVRQSDAHAWAEVWIKKKGWLRFDPTSAVAPERVEKGFSAALMPDEIPEFFISSQSGILQKGFQKLRLGWDAINYQWNTKIIGYTINRQKHLLGKLGFKLNSFKNILLVIVTGSSSILILILIFYLRLKSNTEPNDILLNNYLIFTKKLEKTGITRPLWSGPLDFAKKASSQRPDIRSEINSITHLYTLLRYGGKNNDPDLFHDFRKMVKAFKPKKLRA